MIQQTRRRRRPFAQPAKQTRLRVALAGLLALAVLPAYAGDTSAQASVTRDFHLRGDAQTVITQALAQFGETAQFLGLPPRQTLRFDLDAATPGLTRALLGHLTHTLVVPSGESRVLVVPDTPENRKQYLIEDTETIDLPGLSKETAGRQEDVQNILTKVFSIPRVNFHRSSITLTAAPDVLDQVNATIRSLYTHDSQVQLHVRCYLVSRNRNLDLGVTPPASTTVFNVLTEADSLITSNASVIEEAIAEGLISSDASAIEIAALLVELGYAGSSPLANAFEYFGNGITTTGVEPDALTLNASLTTSTTTELQDATLHLLDHETGRLHIGEKYPVMTSQYTAVSATSTTVASTASGTYVTPSIDYVDLGLMLEATPSIHGDGSIDLTLKMALRSLDGTGVESIPIIATQEFSSALTVRTGMTTVMVSNLTRTDTGENTGLPGLNTTNRSDSGQDEQLVVTITPELTRAPRPPDIHAGD